MKCLRRFPRDGADALPGRSAYRYGGNKNSLRAIIFCEASHDKLVEAAGHRDGGGAVKISEKLRAGEVVIGH